MKGFEVWVVGEGDAYGMRYNDANHRFGVRVVVSLTSNILVKYSEVLCIAVNYFCLVMELVHKKRLKKEL